MAKKARKKKMAQPVVAETIRLEFVIPCHNEAATLRTQVEKVLSYLDKTFTDSWRLIIIDSGSSDDTLSIARDLAKRHRRVRAIKVELPGRGLALRTAIQASRAEILLYMDEDLSTSLETLPKLVARVKARPKTLAIASRIVRGSRVRRSLHRGILSHAYSWLARLFLRIGIQDFQCGCKAFRVRDAQALSEHVVDNKWFFDTELLFRAWQQNYLIQEEPVEWCESKQSSVKLLSTSLGFLGAINRLSHERSRWWHIDTILLGTLMVGFAGLLFATLAGNGWANTYYTAAALAGAKNWSTFFFGGFDSSGYISVDKPPLAIWLSSLSVRLFGAHGLAILLPHLAAGVATLVVVYVMVRRYFGTLAACLAGLCLMFTPIAVIAFRYNNPDAILTFCLSLATYGFLRVLERPSWRWSVLAGAMVGAAFMTKMLQALIVVPVFIAGFIWFAQGGWRSRWRDFIIASSAFLVTALWWPIAVWLTPVSSRPYVGGSVTNNIWELIIGYNGLNRFMGKDWYQPTGAELGAAFGGQTGILRFFNEAFGSVVAWVLPLALIVGVFLLVQLWWSRESKQFRAISIWLGFVILHIAIISFTKGTIHPHYAVVIAPMAAALVASVFWYFREVVNLNDFDAPGLLLGIGVVCFSASILPLIFWRGRIWPIWIAFASIGLVVVVFATYTLARARRSRMWMYASVGLTFLTLLFAPVASSLASERTTQHGFIVSAEPLPADIIKLWPPASETPQELTKFLIGNQGSARWVAASITSYDVAAVEIASGLPAMSIGGFSGVDNPLSLNEFISLVNDGKVRYFIVNRNQSSEVGQCGLTFRFDKRTQDNSKARPAECDVSRLDHNEKSTNNIAVWAQQHRRVQNPGFENWEVYDLR